MGLSLIWPDDHSKELVVLTVDDFDIVNLMQLTQKMMKDNVKIEELNANIKM